LAVPLESYQEFFALPFTQAVVQRYQLKLIVYNASEEAITKWHE